jgi:hypothetical protein
MRPPFAVGAETRYLAAGLLERRPPMKHQDGEIRDVPFLKNDMKDELPTTGKPLDPADGPGKADAELGDEIEVLQPSLAP